jgi:hypothetical protein
MKTRTKQKRIRARKTRAKKHKPRSKTNLNALKRRTRFKSRSLGKCKHKTMHKRTYKRKMHRGGIGFGHIIQNTIHSGSNTLNALKGVGSTPNPLPWKDQYN